MVALPYATRKQSPWSANILGVTVFMILEDTINETDWYPFPGEFYKDPLPQTPEEYLQYVDTVSDFLHKRNMRIAEWAAKKL